MTLLELLFLSIVLYIILFYILSAFVDSQVDLWYNEHFGTPISALRGKVVWVTGASSGIGKELAIVLAKHGVRLVLSARRTSQLELVQRKCLEKANGVLEEKDLLVLTMDMLDIKKHEQYFQKVIDHFGHLDILVNNAGRSQRANWESINVQVDRDLFELDVFSVLNLSRVAVRYFLQHAGGRGHVACTSSIAGLAPVPFSATYVAAKNALNSYLIALQVEHPGIDVTVFAPGPVATAFLDSAFAATPGTKVNQGIQKQKRMTSERCGHLFAVSLANKMQLTWCALFPINFLLYICRNPTIGPTAYKILGRGVVNKLREGKL